MHSILHSFFPRRLLSHSIPSPVHSAFLLAASSAAALARAVAVELIISIAVALNSSARDAFGDRIDGARGWNQLLLKSKKQRSDQWHDVRNRITRRKLQ
jgi:hypothetical protein